MPTSTGTGWAQLRQQARSLETQVSNTYPPTSSSSKLTVCADRNTIPYLFTIFRRLQHPPQTLRR